MYGRFAVVSRRPPFRRNLALPSPPLQAIEKEHSAVRLDTLEQICKGIGVPVNMLLTDELAPVETGSRNITGKHAYRRALSAFKFRWAEKMMAHFLKRIIYDSW